MTTDDALSAMSPAMTIAARAMAPAAAAVGGVQRKVKVAEPALVAAAALVGLVAFG